MKPFDFILSEDRHRMMRFLLTEIGYRNSMVLFLIMGCMSLLDLAGIAVIFPFLKLITEPALARSAFFQVGFFDPSSQSHEQLAILLCGGLLLFYAVKSVTQAYLLRRQARLLAICTARLSNALTSGALHARYASFQETAASETAGIISVAPHASLALAAILQAANDALLLLLMFVGFLVLQPAISLAVLLVGGAVAAIIYRLVIRRSAQVAAAQRSVDIQRYRLLFSIATAIRDIKIMGLEELFARRGARTSAEYAELSWRYNFLNSMPRVLVEFFALAAIALVSLTVVLSEMPLSDAGPLLGLGVIATIRAIPSFSRLMGSINTFGASAQYVRMLMELSGRLERNAVVRQDDALKFARSIELSGVEFRYGDKVVLDGVAMHLARNESIGIVGSSGAGKTTLLDIFTGLQQASSGEFRCDGELFDPFTSRALHGLIGYVPQAITLLDESISFNVSFDDKPDSDRVLRALSAANLSSLVQLLPEGIETRVGENGLRLSGGQRQRIGIARALYRQPEILVFDEATSALDTQSERELTAEIDKLRGRVSIVIVAHRLSTVKSCDRIYVLSGGRVEASGTHGELLLKSHTYQMLYAGQAAGQER